MGLFFDDVRFPDEFKVGSSGGPIFDVDITSKGGATKTEFRTLITPIPVRRLDMSKIAVNGEMLQGLMDFIYGMQGPFVGFRVRDWMDYKSVPFDQQITAADQVIGTGDGANDTFQIVKTYGVDSRVVSKPILKIADEDNNLLVAVEGVLQVLTTDYTVDINTGIITFEVGSIPADTEVVTCGYLYDTPVRFEDTDFSDLSWIGPVTQEINSLRFIELLNP